MSMKQVLEAYELLSRADICGQLVADQLRIHGVSEIEIETVSANGVSTDFLSCLIHGDDAARPTIGIIGRLGGLGARPGAIGLVSDADGAIAAIATAFKLGDMAMSGDVLPASIRIHTHICPSARTRPGTNVPMMQSPLDARQMMAREVHQDMAVIFSVDTSRGNRLVNRRGVAITPVAKEGWLLPIPDWVLDTLSWVTGELPSVLPLTTLDITPQENGLPHINSIMQPATVGTAPVLGIALIAQTSVPGCATGASQAIDIDQAVRLLIELAKRVDTADFRIYEDAVWREVRNRYGPMDKLQAIAWNADKVSPGCPA